MELGLVVVVGKVGVLVSDRSLIGAVNKSRNLGVLPEFGAAKEPRRFGDNLKRLGLESFEGLKVRGSGIFPDHRAR